MAISCLSMDGGDGFLGRPQHLPHSEDRNNVALIADAHHQSVDNGQRERQLQQERGALARASECTSMRPRSFCICLRTTSMPTPRPETSVILSAVEKPG